MNNIRQRKVRCCHGHTHDSKAEAIRCNELHTMQAAGEISDLRLQVPFELIPFRKYIGTENERKVEYICDFLYLLDGRAIVEDVKSPWTRKDAVYILKRKMFKARYGDEYTFREVVR